MSPKIVDPSPLAARLWQTIWAATGKIPVKCLYNVVELFIFKFLSDLKILNPDIAFNHVYEKTLDNPEDALEFYAHNAREKIHKLFPEGSDRTTIINGTIFVAENGEPNLSQSILFQRCLKHLHQYSQEFGPFTKIDKQFKTKLYESFLKEEVEALGQYFTPRKIVQSIIRMAGLDEPSFQYTGKRFCDPFCGVGGFPLELLNMNEGMRECYRPDADKNIHLPFVIHGFDKGFERDDERTIIMAKANMLIYLAELLFANPDCSPKFAKIFNDTFTLFRDNLATFGHIISSEVERYHYILSNPPYVTRGSGIIKEEIRKTPRTANEYPINALGLEGVALEWIVKSLQKGGKAFVLIPDGILTRTGGKRLRDHILSECFLDALISLPKRTFFANFKHTYILAITKKNDKKDEQTAPVFTYLISNIGERLTSVRREEIEEDDLPEMEVVFKMFNGAKSSSKNLLEKSSLRCKVQDITKFKKSPHWVIDRWWTRKERIKAGIEESLGYVNKTEIDKLLGEFNAALMDYEKFRQKITLEKMHTQEIGLGDKKLFDLSIGRRVLKKQLIKGGEHEVPVYSANVFQPMGYVDREANPIDHNAVLWGIDGNFGLRCIAKGEILIKTDHCGAIQILENTIIPEFLLYALTLRREEETFDRSFRASLANMRRFTVHVPVLANGTFDVKMEKEIAARFTDAQEKKAKLNQIKTQLDDLYDHYAGS